jgi:hypothetical protein
MGKGYRNQQANYPSATEARVEASGCGKSSCGRKAMNNVREVVKSVIAEMEGIVKECNPIAAESYRRLSIIDYADYLKRSPERSPEMNQIVFEKVLTLQEKAISLGASRERIEKTFAGLRKYWLPRLKEVAQ